jgi:hypothetical protein
MSKNYIPVLVCSSSKTKDWFWYKGQAIKFVASPQMAPKDEFTYYKPDDPIPGENRTWRDLVLNGQNDPGIDLVPAYKLYVHKLHDRDIYEDFYEEFGSLFYILSAGWGIIRADFKIPAYDITYSDATKVPPFAKRKKADVWPDINHLTEDKEDSAKFDSDSEIILFAGSTYRPHFQKMTQSPSVPYTKKILVRTNKESENGKTRAHQDFIDENYYTTARTNWYYEAAGKFLGGNGLQPFDLNESKEYKESKSKYHESYAAYHPDHLDDQLDEKDQFDQETTYEPSPHHSETKNIFMALLVSIIAGVIFVNIIQGCPTQKEAKPNRTPSPSVEYVLPKAEGSSITVKSDVLTKHFGISYEQRQSSNLFMKDSHEYRYNGNGTWTITKKGAVNNTNKNYIDTSNKDEVENYLHGLGF